MTPTRKTAPPASRKRSTSDTNGGIAALLRDLAAVQKSKQSAWGYKRAANADPGPRRADRIVSPARRDASQDPEHRPLVDARHPRGADRPGSSPTIEQAMQRERPEQRRIERRRDAGGGISSAARRCSAALRNKRLRGPRARRLPRRSPDALDLQRRQPDARRRSSTPGSRAATSFSRRHRSLVRAADRRRRVDGGAGAAAPRDRSAEQASTAARFRLLKGIEANIRADGSRRHDAGRAGPARDRRRGAALGAARRRPIRPPAW